MQFVWVIEQVPHIGEHPTQTPFRFTYPAVIQFSEHAPLSSTYPVTHLVHVTNV